MKVIAEKSPLHQIKHWFEQNHHDPSAKDIQTQAADYLTAVTSFLLASQEIGTTSPAREELGFSVNVIDFIQRRVRASSLGIELDFDSVDREMMLRTLCAQIHSCIGLAHMLEMDIGGALQELAESDQIRLDRTGHPVFGDAKSAEGNPVRRPNYIQYT